jgi:hypothetical protein
VLSSSPHLPSLVSCRSHSWDFTLWSFPLTGIRCASSASAPLLPFPARGFTVTTVTRSSRYPATRPSSGAFPSSKSVHAGPGVSPNSAADAPVGFLPSKGLPRHRITSISRGFLSRSCGEAASGLATRLDLSAEPQSVTPVPSGWSPSRAYLSRPQEPTGAGLAETAVLPGVPSLFIFLDRFGAASRPGLSFRLGFRSASPPPDEPSLGLGSSDRSTARRTLRVRHTQTFLPRERGRQIVPPKESNHCYFHCAPRVCHSCARTHV